MKRKSVIRALCIIGIIAVLLGAVLPAISSF